MDKMTLDMQIRAAALNAAIELGKQGATAHGRSQDVHATVAISRRLEEYIRSGELGKPEPGTF